MTFEAKIEGKRNCLNIPGKKSRKSSKIMIRRSHADAALIIMILTIFITSTNSFILPNCNVHNFNSKSTAVTSSSPPHRFLNLYSSSLSAAFTSPTASVFAPPPTSLCRPRARGTLTTALSSAPSSSPRSSPSVVLRP